MGGAVHEVEKFAGPILDVAAIATGNPELLPFAQAAGSTISGVSQGESFGKALGQGAIGGAEALAGQEALGALGIGSGNSLVNNALGIDISPGATGLPDVGGYISNAADKVGNALGFTQGGSASPIAGTSASGTALDANGNPLSATNPVSTSVSPSAGSIASAGNIGELGGQQIGEQLGGGLTGEATGTSPGLGTLASGAASDSALGAAGTDAIGSTGSGLAGQFAAGVGGAPSLAAPAVGDLASAAPAAGGAAAPSNSLLGTLGNAAAKAALPAAGIAYDIAKGPAKLPSASQALQPRGAATGPLLQLEQSAAQEASTGQLTPSQQASVLQYVQESQNALIQQLANAGVTNVKNDSRYIQGMQQIQQQALALQNQYITQAINTATSAGGAASGNIATVANQQIQQDAAYQDALAKAFGALGESIGGGSYRVAAA